MNIIKQSAAEILGILLFGLIAAIIPAAAQTTDVNVVNTPTVILPRGSTIGIDSSNNTVKLDPTAPVKVRGEKTEVILNQVINVDIVNYPHFSAKVDVSEYKQIRIVVRNETLGANAQITPFLYPENGFNYGAGMVPFEKDPFQNVMNKVYDTPGNFIQIMLQGSGSLRVVIYGRRN
jgi:hypothetical protein